MKHTMVVAVLLICTGAGLFFVTMHNLSLDNKFEAEGIKTNALVTKQFTSRPDRRSNPDHYLRVSYMSETGTSHELNERVLEEFWTSHPEGSAVDVRYLKSRPDTAEILGVAPRGIGYSVQTVASIVLFAGGVILLLYKLFK